MKNLIMLLAIAVILASGCLSQQGTIKLDGVEVREYEGEKLDSLEAAFRENSIKGPQYIDNETYTLEVTGLVGNPGNYTYDEVLETHQSYEKIVTLYCVEGWDAKILWEGVLVRDMLNDAGPFETGAVVIFHAHDGYTTSFPIEYLLENDILMAYKMNGVTIPPERGFPFQLIAEEKWGYKWIKWITRIEVSDDIFHRGYWESRGYSNAGDLDESFFDRN